MPPPRSLKKVKAPTTASAEQILQRQQGALLGLAVGEALGIRHERRKLAAPPFPSLADGPVMTPSGGGHLGLPPGQVSWGSEMAQVLSASLREYGRYDVVAVGKAYARWLPHAVDCPETTRQALAHVADGRSPEFSGRRVWLEHFQRDRDNGALARVAPIGVYFHALREERLQASLQDSAITHFDPICRLAGAALNGLIAAAINAPAQRIAPSELLQVAESELAAAASLLGVWEPDWILHTKEVADLLREDLELAQRDDPLLYGPEVHLLYPWPTLVRVTYRLALWELFHAPSFEAGLLDVVNRGGDSDTNAAVAGALLGAVMGDTAIPAEWVETVMNAPGSSSGLHWSHYHPRFLVTLAGAKPGEATRHSDDWF